MSFLETVNCTKTFGNFIAVNNVNLKVETGEFLGLLGPNGAGKTTLTKMICGLLKPTKGEIRLFGRVFTRDCYHLKKKIGLVPQHNNLESELTAWENLELHGRLFQMPSEKRERNIQKVLAFTGLEKFKDREVEKFSGGMKRRLLLARALLPEPELLLLDEPTTGLDPEIRQELWQLLKDLNKEGLTMLLTTHYLEEAEVLCQRLVFMYEGKVVKTGSPGELTENMGRFAVETKGERGMETYYFPNHEKARAFMEKRGQEGKLRRVKLEDVYMEIINERKKIQGDGKTEC